MLPRFRAKQKQFTPWHGFLLLVVIGAALTLEIVDGLNFHRNPPPTFVPAVSYAEIVAEVAVSEVPVAEVPSAMAEPVTETPPNEPTVLLAEYNLAVPFTSQAPYGTWDPLHEDACEEAVVYMVQQFYAGTPVGKLDPVLADAELVRQVRAQEALGLTPSINLAELKEFLLQDSKTIAVILDNPTVDDLKALIAAGKPVIVPAAGQKLGNPFFSGEGPLYHMLVIRGYTETTFITNDPGTRQGEEYVYPIEVLMAAIGDWNNGDPVNGAKRILYIDSP